MDKFRAIGGQIQGCLLIALKVDTFKACVTCLKSVYFSKTRQVLKMTQKKELIQNKVTQDNALIEASYSMTLDEKRLLIAAISRLDPESKAWLKGIAEVEISVKEWVSLYSISDKDAYQRLNRASIRLFHRYVRIYGDNKKGKDIRWIQSREYDEGCGTIRIVFAGVILHYLTGMVDQFTSYDLLGVQGLKSIHSIRMYEVACQFKSVGHRSLTLEQIKNMLDLGDSYPRWVDLKKRVIDRACKEISEKSDLELTYTMIKQVRSVVGIKLKIKKKKQMDLFAED